MEIKNLKKKSPFIYFFERVFFIFQYLSPANILFGIRVDIFKEPTRKKSAKKAQKRGRRIETYVTVWFVVLLLCSFLAPRVNCYLVIVVLFFPLFRVFDIIQAAININFFDRLRFGEKEHYVLDVTRILILSIWNFFEILFCFAIVYSSMLDKLKDAKSIADAYYFSVVTQLTIGYGDLQPIGIVKLFAPLQGVLGLIFALCVLSRFVSFLPKVEPIPDEWLEDD